MKRPDGILKHTCPTCGAHLLLPVEPMHAFADEAASWIEHLELTGRSYCYVGNVRQRVRDYLVPRFGTMDVTTIKTHHVHALYHDLLKAGILSSKTIKHILDTLRCLMMRLMSLEIIDRVPVFPRVIVVRQEPRWIDAEQQARVLAAIGPEHRMIFRVLCETGMRPGEACALRRRDLVDGGLVIERAMDELGRIKSTKTGNRYQRPITVELHAALTDHVRLLMPDVAMFRVVDGSLYHRRTLYRIWVRACKAVGLRIALYHGVRHSRVSQLRADMERDMFEALRAELGHTSSATTKKHYALPGSAKHGGVE